MRSTHVDRHTRKHPTKPYKDVGVRNHTRRLPPSRNTTMDAPTRPMAMVATITEPSQAAKQDFREIPAHTHIDTPGVDMDIYKVSDTVLVAKAKDTGTGKRAYFYFSNVKGEVTMVAADDYLDLKQKVKTISGERIPFLTERKMKRR